MRAVLRILLYLMALALGAAMMAYNWRPELFSLVIEFEAQHSAEAQILAGGMAGVLLLSPLSIMLRWIQARRRSREISYTTDTGRVSVNLIAIQEALSRAVEHEDCVRKAHVHLYEDRVKRQVVIEASMTFWEVPNVTERNRQCQIVLRRRFAELMPEQRVVVNLNVHRITPRRESSKAETRDAPLALPAPIDHSRTETRIENLSAVDPFAGTPLAGTSGLGQTPPDGQYVLPPPATTIRAHDQITPSSEDDLYMGPTYPVGLGDDDDDSNADNLIGKAVPVSKSGRKLK